LIILYYTYTILDFVILALYIIYNKATLNYIY